MASLLSAPVKQDLVCYSHLRWNFVFQRPQHLMTRFSKHARVFFIEEPLADATGDPYLETRAAERHLQIIIPHVQPGLSFSNVNACLQSLITQLFHDQGISDFIAWYYTPMALFYCPPLQPALQVFDCMDELSAFKDAPVALKEKEQELLQNADVVFTGGHSLYEVKKHQHPNVHFFPSSVDTAHFAKARTSLPEPNDQAAIPGPRFGFFGVLDERLDIPLLTALSQAKPHWHFILIGPVVKIDPASLPQADNIHYLGMQLYDELPNYICHWDVAVLLFALNDSTRFISPTKTPEYLAAGKPVISTPIHDVVYTYGDTGLIHIATDAEGFIAAAENSFRYGEGPHWLASVDDYLSQTSWNKTHEQMAAIMKKALTKAAAATTIK